MAATNTITLRSALDPRNQTAHLPVFLHLRTTDLPGVPTASCAANMHNKEEWNTGITNMSVREEDVHDRDPVRQGHVSASLFTPSSVACESFAGQLCLHRIDAWTFCFKSLSPSPHRTVGIQVTLSSPLTPFCLCLLSFVFCLLSFVFCLLSFVFCLLSFVFCLCLLSFVFVFVFVSRGWQGQGKKSETLKPCA